jgi:hypothetical protein
MRRGYLVSDAKLVTSYEGEDMSQAVISDATVEQRKVLAAVENEAAGIRRSLDKEGAGLGLDVDAENAILIATLERHRIVCEGCLLPEHLVQTMLNKALSVNGLKYKVETRNWLLTEEALTE